MARQITINTTEQTCLEIDQIFQKYYSLKISKVIFYEYIRLDPTTILYKNSNIPIKMGLYCKWLLNFAHTTPFKQDEYSLCFNLLKHFNIIKNKLPVPQKDISFFKDLNSLQETITPFIKLSELKFQTRNYFKQINKIKNLTLATPDTEDIIYNDEDLYIINTESNLKVTAYSNTLERNVARCLKHFRFFKYRLLQKLTIYFLYFKRSGDYIIIEVHPNGKQICHTNYQGRCNIHKALKDIKNAQRIKEILKSKPLSDIEKNDLNILEQVRLHRIPLVEFNDFFLTQPIHLQIEIVRLISTGTTLLQNYITPVFLNLLDRELYNEFVEGIVEVRNYKILNLLNVRDFQRVIKKVTLTNTDFTNTLNFFFKTYKQKECRPFRGKYKLHTNNIYSKECLTSCFDTIRVTRLICKNFQTLSHEQRLMFLSSGPRVDVSFLKILTENELYIYCFCRKHFICNQHYFDVDFFVSCFLKNIILT